MNATRHFSWVLLILGAISGCGSEEGSAPPPSVPSKATPPKATPEPAKTSEMLPLPTKDESKKPDASKKDEPPALDGPKSDATPSKATKLTQEEIANIKTLPASEHAAALAQGVCPVSDGPLGGMGKPVVVSALGRTFYLCCASCQDEVKSDPKSVVAKLEKK